MEWSVRTAIILRIRAIIMRLCVRIRFFVINADVNWIFSIE